MEPIDNDAFWSPTGVQVAPASVERQMPPMAPPMRTVLPVESEGSTAMVVTRPVTGEKKPPVVGVGPMGFHVEVTALSGERTGRGATSADSAADVCLLADGKPFVAGALERAGGLGVSCARTLTPNVNMKNDNRRVKRKFVDLRSCIGPPGQQNWVEHAAFVFCKAGGSPRGNTYLQTGYLKDLDTDGQTTTSP